MAGYKLTVRQGPRVTRERFDSLDPAIEALEARAKDIRSAGPLEPRKMLREFSAETQVAGRVEISTGSFLRRGEEAGIDIMGDGALVAYAGGTRRAELDPGQNGPFEAVREVLMFGSRLPS